MLVIGKLPAKKNVIMFESFQGKQYSDNPRAIYEYIKAHYPGYICYWSALLGDQQPDAFMDSEAETYRVSSNMARDAFEKTCK